MTGVIYARYSSDNQREESIEGQLRECKVFAEKNGIDVVGIAGDGRAVGIVVLHGDLGGDIAFFRLHVDDFLVDRRFRCVHMLTHIQQNKSKKNLQGIGIRQKADNICPDIRNGRTPD